MKRLVIQQWKRVRGCTHPRGDATQQRLTIPINSVKMAAKFLSLLTSPTVVAPVRQGGGGRQRKKPE